MDNQEQIDQILKGYKEYTSNVRHLLKELGVPGALIMKETTNLPDTETMLPEDIIEYYLQVKTMVILYLARLGFSNREIGRRLGGHTYNFVRSILKEN